MACYDSKNPNCGCCPPPPPMPTCCFQGPPGVTGAVGATGATGATGMALPLSKSARPPQVHREQMRVLRIPERKATLY